MPAADRVSAHALLAMALGLVILYHAGPVFWASRTLSVLGCAAPLWVLGWRGDFLPARLSLWGVVMLAVYTCLANLAGWHPHVAYAVAFVWAQGMMTLVWLYWRLERPSWVATVAAILAALGTAMAAYVHVWLVDSAPPDPLAWTASDGPVDAISALARGLLLPEAIMFWIAVAVWLWVVARPWLRERLQ